MIVTASAATGAVVEVPRAVSSYQLAAVAHAVEEVLCHVKVFADKLTDTNIIITTLVITVSR